VDKARKPRPYLSNLIYARMRPFFAWCVDEGKLKVNPMIGIKKPFNGEEPRDRPWFKGDLGDQAIRTLWQCADKLADKTEGRFLKCLLLTGQRKSALAKMRWEEIDQDWFWNAPKSRRKINKRLHSIPLPKYMQRILHPRQASGYVFPGKRDGHIQQSSGILQNRIIKAGAMDDFFLHGCKHILETKMGELRDKHTRRSLIPPWIRDLILDHAPSRGSGKGYDHNDYRVEMEDALEIWADHVEQLVSAVGVRRLRS
jgi:integrase